MSLKNTSTKIISKIVCRYIANSSDGGVKRISSLLTFIVPRTRPFLKRVKSNFTGDTPQSQLWKKIFVDSNKNFREKSVNNLIFNGAVLNQAKRNKARKSGNYVPYTILMSPSMRCNLSCVGCYAKSYSKSSDLSLETIDRIIKEGKEMGVVFFTILGGEPFIRDDLFEIYKKHNDVFFNIYTNGTLLDRKKVKKISELGNILVALSIEGGMKETDERREKGVYKKVIEAMDLLKEFNIPFGYSATVTTKNINVVTSDQFVDFMIEKGAIVGWHFIYMPVGGTFDVSLMPNAKQRLYLKEQVNRIRTTKPIFAIDFWNDAPHVNGCIAGNRYIHINHKGDIEPCVFTHFAEKNIKDCSIKEAMNCHYFKEMRKRQPYSDNLYRPCMLIDNPEVSRDLFNCCNIYPTHEGAEKLLFEINDEIDKYSKDVKEVFDKVWQDEKSGIDH